MIKLLKKKFVISSMLAITILIVVLLGAVNISNAYYTAEQNRMLLESITDDRMHNEPAPDNLPQNKPTPSIMGQKSPSEDSKKSALYFTVEVDGNGEIITVDVSHISSVDEESAKSIYAEIDSDTGIVDNFRYKTIKLPNDGAKTVFLSTSDEWTTVLRVAILSLTIGLVSWGLMFLLILLLAKKAIAPIAENMEKQKHFITDAGHEIKTPLAIIMANTEAMELHTGENKWTANIKTQTNRLTGLTQNMLSLARLESDEYEKKIEQVNFSELVRETVGFFTEPAELRGLSFQTEIKCEISIKAEKENLVSLVSILLDNAVKYSDSDSEISVQLKKDKKTVLTVSNICSNLPNCKPETLFDRFYRGDSARNQKNGGYGIGLSSAKAIAELMSGSITAEFLPDNKILFRFTV